MSKGSVENKLAEYFKEGVNTFLPHISINFVVFSYDYPQLKVLIKRHPDHEVWLLPGGYIKKDENLDDSAYRNLSLSGIDNVFLRQFRTFGDAKRIPQLTGPITGLNKIESEIMNWVSKRFVTVVYYGLVKHNGTDQFKENLLAKTKWVDVNKVENLVIDHSKIVAETRKIFVTELLNYPILSSLLPDTFMLSELRGLYEVILNRTIDRGTFRRKISKMGIIEKVDKRKDAKGRPADIYRFNQDAYLQSLTEVTKFGF